MPRSRGGGGSRRPTMAPSRPQAPPAPQQSRPASTAAHPQAHQGQQQQQQGQGQQRPGLFGQMASTAAGVAVGSSIGHAIGGFFGGGSVQEQQPQQPAYEQQQPQQAQAYNTQYGGGNCELDAKNFTQCLDQNGGNMQICGWYLEQLKACQAASARWGQ